MFLYILLIVWAAAGIQASARSGLLKSRQSALAYPPACTTQCVTIAETWNSPSCGYTCLCTSNNSQALQNCLTCYVNQAGNSSDAQAVADYFNNGCAGANIKVPPISISPGTSSLSTPSTSATHPPHGSNTALPSSATTLTSAAPPSPLSSSVPPSSGTAPSSSATSGTPVKDSTGGAVGGWKASVGPVVGVGIISAVTVFMI